MTRVNLIVKQSETFSTTLFVLDDEEEVINLTGYTIDAQIRKHYSSNTAYEFSTVLGGANGTITLSLSSNASANIPYGRYFYDCLITSNTGVVSRPFEGTVTIVPSVSR